MVADGEEVDDLAEEVLVDGVVLVVDDLVVEVPVESGKT